LRVAHGNGKLAATPLLVRGVCWSIFGFALVLDVAFNFTVGTVLFLRLPKVRRPTFTQRCKDHLEDEDFRGRMARFVCDGWLNPFEAGHCR
jgi:hypothetical protein